MKQVIVITGASSGFGALAARCLAEAGHTVDPSQDGAEIVNGVADRVRAEMFRRIGLEELLHPAIIKG
jgi:NADP-dependent 3-hydroxy acid dehydrogenase YdfG